MTEKMYRIIWTDADKAIKYLHKAEHEAERIRSYAGKYGIQRGNEAWNDYR